MNRESVKKRVLEILEEGRIATHHVRLEYGHQSGQFEDYEVIARDNNEALTKAIKKHRASWPYHNESMLKNNATVTKI